LSEASKIVAHRKDGDFFEAEDGNSDLAQLRRSVQSSVNRKVDDGNKLPDQSNELIKCACGCNGMISQFDNYNRRRKYIHGHNVGKKNKNGTNINSVD
jgi:hypothetical protein